MHATAIRGLYCLRCNSRKVVRGKMESANFFPLRPLLRSLLGKPVALQKAETLACLECGLAWNEVEPYELRRNLHDHGLVQHSTIVMQVVRGERVDVAL